MPQNKFALARYYIIDNLLHKYKYVKTSTILDYCKEITGYEVTRRTIQMDISAMKNDAFLGFFAPIDYCNVKKAYYYSDLNYKLLPFHFTTEEIKLLEKILQIYYHDVGIVKILKCIIQKMRHIHID